MKRVLICALALMMLALPALADKDDNFTLRLRGNPTTGYQWLYEVEDPSVLTVVDEGYAQDDVDGQATGVGGTYRFSLKGLKDGHTTVTFVYKRSWETNDAPLYTLVYKAEADDDGDAKVYDCEFYSIP